MPRAEQLPPDLADIAFRNGVELTHARWESDVQLLIKALRPHVQVMHSELDREKAKAGDSATQTARTERAVIEPGVSTTEPGAGRQPVMMSIRVIVTALVAVIALAFGGYAWYSKSSKAPEIATKPEALTVPNGRAATNEPKAKTPSDQRAPAELEAGKLAKTQAADKIAADELAAKQAADEIEAARLVKEKREREAKIRAGSEAGEAGEAGRRQDSSRRIDGEAGRRQDSSRRIDGEAGWRQDRSRPIAHRARWPSYNFPPPNGGSMVFTIMPDGNPACASYNGASCLWGLSYEQIDFARLKPLVCGEALRARWGVTGYEDPKHWCSLARRVSGIRQ